MNEIELIHNILNGQSFLYKKLVIKYQKLIIMFIYRLCHRREIADEIAQKVFEKAFFKLSSYDPAKSSFSTWLHTIAKNLTLNYLKSKNNSVLTENFDSLVELNTPESLMNLSEEERLFEQSISDLPLQFKIVLQLFYMSELSLNEIAVIENATESAIKSRLFRGKELLKQNITQGVRNV